MDCEEAEQHGSRGATAVRSPSLALLNGPALLHGPALPHGPATHCRAAPSGQWHRCGPETLASSIACPGLTSNGAEGCSVSARPM